MLHRGRVFALSFEEAPNGKIVELALNGDELGTVVPERTMSPRDIWMADGAVFVSYLECGNILIKNWTLDGIPIGNIETPPQTTVQICPRFGMQSAGFFYTCESFACVPDIYEHEPPAGVERPVLSRDTPSAHSTGLGIYQRSFVARDGMTVPITIVTSASTELSGDTPIVMTSYGGFGASVTPRSSVLVTIMLELGAAFALPHIRGGGEFGKAWHNAGRGRNKQTTFNDFIDAGDWLCSAGFTKPSRLAIFGGSNSGLLVGAAITQRPDLFRAALCIAPLLDMVRYESFDQAAKWQSEYGSVERPEDFHMLHSYSPYHHVQESVNYPATLFVTGDNDDRCNPAHVRKMAALLQGRIEQHNPILVDYSPERGHSSVMPLSVRIDSLARRIAFLCKELGIQVPRELCHETTDC
jgi:prolyl oligopeptidase